MRRLVATVAVACLATACGSTVPLTSTGQVPGSADGLSGPTAGAVDGTTGTTGSSAVGTSGSTSGTSGVVGGTTGSPGAVSGTTGGTRGGTTTSGTTGLVAAPSGPIPATGPGWDKKYVYIGVTTQKDVATAAQGVGAAGLDAGDQEGQAKAVIQYLNARGGLFGRQIKPLFHDQSTVATASNPDNAGAVACSYFTQDNHVIAVLNPVTLMDVDSFRACLAKKKVPLFSASVAPVSQATAAKLQPYFYQSVAPTWDVLAPALVKQLKAFNYFGTAWNTSTGTSVPGKATLGILTPDTPEGIRVAGILTKHLAAVGQPVKSTFRFDPKNNSTTSSAVVQFRSAGVDHVIGTESTLVSFQLQASTQRYRPRYGVHTLNAPLTFLQTNGGAQQNTGDVGVGWAPTFDVDDAHDPGAFNSGVSLCNQISKAGGQNTAGKRLAHAVSFAFCDGIRLIAESAVQGGGLTGVNIYNGMQKVGPTFASAFSFAPGLGQNRLFVPGGVRPLLFDSGCACFRYSSTATTRL